MSDSSPASPLGAPEVATGELDREGLESLFQDYAAHIELSEVRARGAAASMSRPDALDLDTAFTQLLAGEVNGLQIAYRHDGENWIDTLLTTAAGFRLVRTRH